MPPEVDLVKSLIKEAIFHRAKREYTPALARLEHALELAPTDPDALQELGRTLSYSAAETGDLTQKTALLDRAEAALKRAATFPGVSRKECLHDLAWVYDERGDFTRAVELYREAVAADVDERGAHRRPDFGQVPDTALAYNLACSLAKAGRGDEALDVLEPVIADAWKWAEKDRDLEPLRQSPAWRPRLDALLEQGRRING